MTKDQNYRELPTARRGTFLKFIDDTSFSHLVLLGLGVYIAVVLFISVVEFLALKMFGVQWIAGENGATLGWWDTVYFNFVTILTVGYGDFSPIGFGKFLSTLEALIGVGLFAGAISLLTIKALRPSSYTIVFSRYAYYCLHEQRFMIIFLNTSVARLENCSISSYFKLGRDWRVKPAIAPPFLTTAVQTFFVDEHSENEIAAKLTDGDCLRVCVSGNLLGSEVAASVQYKPDEIVVLQNRESIANYQPFWRPDFNDPKFRKMFHYRPDGTETLADRFTVRSVN